MKPAEYEVLARYAGRHLARAHPWPVAMAHPFPLDPARAVYVVCDRPGACLYVGSVARERNGLARRMAEHLVDRRKLAEWDHAWVLPLRSTTSTTTIRQIEGVVGAHLGPLRSQRLPALKRL